MTPPKAEPMAIPTSAPVARPADPLAAAAAGALAKVAAAGLPGEELDVAVMDRDVDALLLPELLGLLCPEAEVVLVLGSLATEMEIEDVTEPVVLVATVPESVAVDVAP